MPLHTTVARNPKRSQATALQSAARRDTIVRLRLRPMWRCHGLLQYRPFGPGKGMTLSSPASDFQEIDFGESNFCNYLMRTLGIFTAEVRRHTKIGERRFGENVPFVGPWVKFCLRARQDRIHMETLRLDFVQRQQ